MFGIILTLVVSLVGVQPQLRVPPGRRPMIPTLNQAVMRAEPCLRKPKPCAEVITITPQTTMPIVVNAVPNAIPVTSFVTDLPSCSDLCFEDILTCPLGSLGPILDVYGTATDIIKSDLPVSPFLPAASPVSASAPPFSKRLPPALPNNCDSLFLKRVPIPPPFI